MTEVLLELKSGKKLIQIEYTTKKNGDFCYYSYEHHYNSKSSSDRFIEAEFIKMVKNGKVLIQRRDCQNPSRVPKEQVWKVCVQRQEIEKK